MSADFADRTDFDNADRGFIGRLEPGVVKTADGRVVWDIDEFTAAVQGDCPDTVNPSLWRQSKLTANQGLYEVTAGIYQVRGGHVEHDPGRGRHRRHRDRPADLRRVRRRRDRPCTGSTAGTGRSPP